MEKHFCVDTKKVIIVWDMINNYIQNVGLNWVYDKTQMHQGVIVAIDAVTSFNEIGMIQTLLLQSGKYKLYFFLMYVLLLA
jgi:hypothetical protein